MAIYLTAMSSSMNSFACAIDSSSPRIVTPVSPFMPGSRSVREQAINISTIDNERNRLNPVQCAYWTNELTNFDMHVEVVLDFTDFAATSANDHTDFLRININFAWCTWWIKVVVVSWCATVVEVHSRLAFAVILPAGTILAETSLIVSVAIGVEVWTLSYRNKWFWKIW